MTNDGRFILSGCNDKTIRAWDVLTGGLVGTYGGHADVPCCIKVTSIEFVVCQGTGGIKRTFSWSCWTSVLMHLTVSRTTWNHLSWAHSMPQISTSVSPHTAAVVAKAKNDG